MTPEALRATLARLGLTQAGAARLLGVRVTTMQRWCSGDREMPPPAIRLLWAMERHPELIEELREMDWAYAG
jgi:DNA-binding transcriptional regulator YiaG